MTETTPTTGSGPMNEADAAVITAVHSWADAVATGEVHTDPTVPFGVLARVVHVLVEPTWRLEELLGARGVELGQFDGGCLLANFASGAAQLHARLRAEAATASG